MKFFMKGFAPAKNLVLIASAGLLLFSSLAQAANHDVFSPGDSQLISSLVFSETAAASNAMMEPETVVSRQYKERWFTANKWHQYLGLGSMALATLTAMAPKPSLDDPETGIHPTLAKSAAVLGGAAVASGLVFHYKDLSWRGLFKNPDNLHAILGTLGTLGYVAAVSEAPDSAHATYGIIGAVSMLAAIKITW